MDHAGPYGFPASSVDFFTVVVSVILVFMKVLASIFCFSLSIPQFFQAIESRILKKQNI